MQLVMSLVGFKTETEVESFCAHLGSSFKFELSYLTSERQLAGWRHLLRGKTASVHACCPETDFFPNLASGDLAVLAQSHADLRSTLRTALDFEAEIVVLHTGYVTDRAMPRNYADRKLILDSPEFVPYVADKKTAVCYSDYITQPVYRHFAQRARENLALAAAEFRKKGILLAAENLNPRVGYLFQTPDEMCELAHFHPDIFLCLDVGHLYIASFVFGFDFLAGVAKILATGKVATCHLHANPSGPHIIEDSHESIDAYGFPIGEVVRLLRASGANAVLEVVEDFERNAHLLRDLSVRGEKNAYL